MSRAARPHHGRLPAMLVILALLLGSMLPGAMLRQHSGPDLGAGWEDTAICGEHMAGDAGPDESGPDGAFCCLGGLCAGMALATLAPAQGLPEPLLFRSHRADLSGGPAFFPPMHFASTLKSRAPPANVSSTRTFI